MLVRHKSVFFRSRAAVSVPEPPVHDELRELLLSEPSVAIACLQAAVSVEESDSSHPMALLVGVLAGSVSSLREVGLRIAKQELAVGGVSIWRESRTIMVRMLSSVSGDAFCARLVGPVLKKLSAKREPHMDACVAEFLETVRVALSDMSDAAAVLLQTIFSASRDARAVGLFVFLRMILPHLTHPRLWQNRSDATVLRTRLVAFARRVSAVAALRHEEMSDELLPILHQMEEGKFYTGVLDRKVEASCVTGQVDMKTLRSFVTRHMAEIREKAKDRCRPDIWNVLNSSGGRLKRSASWT